MHILRHHPECDFVRGPVIDKMQSCDDECDCHRGVHSYILYRYCERWPYRPAEMSISTNNMAGVWPHMCMHALVSGLTDVPATPDLKIGSI